MTTLSEQDIVDMRKTCALGMKLATVTTEELAALLDAWEERDALRGALASLRKAGEKAVYDLTCGDPQRPVLDALCAELDAAEKALRGER